MENSYKNYFETIYSFHDDSHGMDAFIKNKCDAEMLAIIEAISKELGINKQIRLETLPAREGSYDEWLQTTFYANIIASASLLVSILALIFSRIPVKPYKSKIDEENQILDIESKKLDIENKRLEAEKREVELEILKKQLSAINEEATRDSIEEINKKVSMLQDSFFEILSQNIYIKKHLSNFYKTLLDYPKITYISYSHYDINLNLIDKKRTVLKNQFKEFIIDSDILFDYDENARIHIYAPSLVKGKHKWRGYYEKENIIIDFSMKDTEFKENIEAGLINFRNGSMIDAVLLIRIKFDETGNESSRSYSVLTVLQKIDGEIFTETEQGKKFKERKKFTENQLSLSLEEDSKKI